MLAFTAITSIGAMAVAMNAHWQTDEMVYGLTDSGAKVLLADAERLDRLLILSALLSWELDRAIFERMVGIEPVAPGTPAAAQQAGTLLAVPLFHVNGLHASYLCC